MKTIACSLFAALLFLTSCGSLSYYNTPNDLRRLDGTLYLSNGKSVEGKLVIETGNLFGSPVKVYHEGERKPMHFNMHEVTGYRIGNHHYELKEIRESFSLGRHSFFMKRLTPQGSKVHLYELLKKENINKIHTRNVVEYYLELPNKNDGLVYAAGSSHFVPQFEEKASRIFNDCPNLATKIANKEPGYHYVQLNLTENKRVEVLMNIITEYNQCSD